MPEYLVRWEIHLDADTPRAAAERAWQIQQRADSHATFFTLQDRRPLLRVGPPTRRRLDTRATAVVSGGSPRDNRHPSTPPDRR